MKAPETLWYCEHAEGPVEDEFCTVYPLARHVPYVPKSKYEVLELQAVTYATLLLEHIARRVEAFGPEDPADEAATLELAERIHIFITEHTGGSNAGPSKTRLLDRKVRGTGKR